MTNDELRKSRRARFSRLTKGELTLNERINLRFLLSRIYHQTLFKLSVNGATWFYGQAYGKSILYHTLKLTLKRPQDYEWLKINKRKEWKRILAKAIKECDEKTIDKFLKKLED